MIKTSTVPQQKRHVGLTNVRVRAINPTRSQLNKLYGKEDSEDDREFIYKTADRQGSDRIRLNIWLYSEDLDKYVMHTIGIVNRPKTSSDGTKFQYINSTCNTTWVEKEEDLPEWFTHFTDKEGNKTAKKDYRVAFIGEEELAIFLRSWLKMKWFHSETYVMPSIESLMNEDYSELQDLIDSPYDKGFTALLGVRVDQNDNEKDYQSIYGKSFLPYNFKDYVETGKFPSTYDQSTWTRFEKEVKGEYGFNGSYFELVPVTEYDRSKDLARSTTTKVGVTSTNSKY